ncbi:MAG: dephospho-CoA kinase [Clostridium sp.]|nr:dephospho-CoA kinase [Bacteroides sp.]MCM1198393.1 dephospho-CoA kinase [Clostridium sp.]
MTGTLVITGGIGSGKSLVCSFLSELGMPIYDSDSRTRQLYERDRSLLDRIEREIGVMVRTTDGRLDRRLLANAVFSDQSNLSKLESIVHPAVLDDFMSWRDRQLPAPGQNFIVVGFESAIILEKPLFRGIADWTLLVDAPVELRLARASARDGVPKEAVLARMERQKLLNDISEHKTVPPVDYVIVNDGDETELREKVRCLYENITGIL